MPVCIYWNILIYINIKDHILNLLLTSFVVSTCRSNSCFLTAIRDSIVWIFHSSFSLAPFERLLSLKFFSIIYSAAECCSEHSCTSVIVHSTSSSFRQWFLSSLMIAQRAVVDCPEGFGMVYEVRLCHHCPWVLVKYRGFSSSGIKRQTRHVVCTK